MATISVRLSERVLSHAAPSRSGSLTIELSRRGSFRRVLLLEVALAERDIGGSALRPDVVHAIRATEFQGNLTKGIRYRRWRCVPQDRPGTRVVISHKLELHTQCELQYARCRSGCNRPERGCRRDGGPRVRVVGAIDYVERFSAKLETNLLRDGD